MYTDNKDEYRYSHKSTNLLLPCTKHRQYKSHTCSRRQ